MKIKHLFEEPIDIDGIMKHPGVAFDWSPAYGQKALTAIKNAGLTDEFYQKLGPVVLKAFKTTYKLPSAGSLDGIASSLENLEDNGLDMARITPHLLKNKDWIIRHCLRVYQQTDGMWIFDTGSVISTIEALNSWLKLPELDAILKSLRGSK